MRRIATALAVLVALAVTPASAHAATPPAPASAAQMNALMTQVNGLGEVFDIARTRPLPDGRWLTLTGDATAQPGQTLPVYDNAAVVWDSVGPRRVNAPGGHFFPRWPDGSEFWPHDFVIVGTLAYVIGPRVKTYPGYFNWDQLGAFGAVVDVSGEPRFLRYFPTPSSLLDDSHVQWYGAISHDNGTIYLHGVLNDPSAFHGRNGGYVARVPADRLEVPHRWQFRTGSGWTSRHDLAVSSIPLGGYYTTGINGTSAGYTLHKRQDGQWQVVTKRGGDIGHELGRYVGPSPWGPWTWQTLMQVCPMDCYLAGASTIPTNSGKLLVQWSRTDSTPVWAEVPQ